MSARLHIPVGTRFSRLTVREVFVRDHQSWIRWSCSCGKMGESPAKCVTRGETQSCGCLRAEQTAARNQTHGLTFDENGRRRPEHIVWTGMLRCCLDPRSKSFPRYGGRGITVCERWQDVEGFANFFADLGSRPSPAHTLDRIDNEGPYSPENCRWATKEEQAANRRNTVRLVAKGEDLPLAEWSRRTGIALETLRERLRRGWPPDRAVSAAVEHSGRWAAGGDVGVVIEDGEARGPEAETSAPSGFEQVELGGAA